MYTKYQADIKDYGSDFDQQAATSSLINLRKVVSETEEHIFDIIVRVLASSTGVSSYPLVYIVQCEHNKPLHCRVLVLQLEMDELSKQLSETFIPEDDLLFCANPSLDWKTIKALATCDETLSFDEV